MPERELPEHIRARLSEELTSGAPLAAAAPSQARYASAVPAAVPRVRWRLAAAAAASVGLVAIAAYAGQPQTRAWIGQSVGNIGRTVQRPGDENPPSPPASPRLESPGASPIQHRTPQPSQEPSESPEPSQSPEGRESPDPDDSPRPSPSPGGPTPSPSPHPSDE